jgi:hypothetical protein
VGIRQRIEEKPAVALTFAIIGITIALGIVTFQLLGGRRPNATLRDSRFYSDDDGQTWFIDLSTSIPVQLGEAVCWLSGEIFGSAESQN